MRIAETAHRHEVNPEDIRHAVLMALGSIPRGDLVMYVGPTRDGNQLLEVGVLGAYTDDPVVIHAMRARRSFIDRIQR